ncbi:hypothetical protein A3E39_01180 [Candidatus Uhrbacteria bacterium RIFCSPHIGHO2_12_FULL_60_25]|uniref:Uncharacterized protein n=1 Tax=Candidatus Uhrbacteria bacterium RIFCSPHIGHO2_12_FULL_60_25 TaxID=1802399 RepID=A0A1F7UKE5_9BACT|nr:MAG: hypothetical protein A3E39_01180 [Candidatus Uhrbacteria bacterium RIFCSPHIGHO2_12_FULL_60_25]
MKLTLKKWLSMPWVWYGVLPVAIGASYWFGLGALSVPKGLRISALPKVFFDQTFYLQILSKDLFNGSTILPIHFRPMEYVARLIWPYVSLSELYVLGIIVSAILSVWFLAILLQKLTDLSIVGTRFYSLLAFLSVQSILILRPGGSSWYVPFFYLGFLLVVLGEYDLAIGKRIRGTALWGVALFISAVYPWYVSVILVTCVLLFLKRFLEPLSAIIILAVGFVIAEGLILMRHDWWETFLRSSTYELMERGALGFSHLPVLSNSILIIILWIIAWTILRRSQSFQRRISPQRCISTEVMLAAWVAVAILWNQSLLTGISILSDHFIYPVWHLSIFSVVAWPIYARESIFNRWRSILFVLAMVAYAFTMYILSKYAIGVYRFMDFSSLLIHIGSWTFLALGLLSGITRLRLNLIWCFIAFVYALIGIISVGAYAMERTQLSSELIGVRSWMLQDTKVHLRRWCADYLTGDDLSSTTGASFSPAMVMMFDHVPTSVLQDRLVEFSKYLNPDAGIERSYMDDMILIAHDAACLSTTARQILNLIPFTATQRIFLSGCDEDRANAIRAAVIARMKLQWAQQTANDSDFCQRIVIHERFSDDWRIPLSYVKLYEDATAVVYGAK